MWQEFETSKEFFKGNYAEALRMHGAGAAIAPAIRVGCLVYLGKLEVARTEAHEISGEHDQIAIAQYFLGVGFTRVSRYEEARAIFSANFSRFRKKNSLSSLFAFLGVAFFRFFCGDFQRAAVLAERSNTLATKHKFPYGEVIAGDLLAHSLVNSGEVRRGLNLFAETLKLVNTIGNGGIKTALQVSILRFEAMHGIDPRSTIKKLRFALKRFSPTDTYSIQEIHLELIRQLVLRGMVLEANKEIEACYDVVYKNQNRRQAAILNLRLAYLQYLGGSLHQARHLLRTAALNLHPNLDLLQLAQLKGLEEKIQRELNNGNEQGGSRESFPFEGIIHKRISSRGVGRPVIRSGEDPLGDLMDKIFVDRDRSLDDVIDRGFLGLLPRVLGVKPYGSYVINGLRSRSVVLVNKGEVALINELSRTQLCLLERLSRSEASKEQLVTEIWGYDYHSGRHDGLVYSAIKNLRARLRWAAHWVESTENGYKLSSQVKLVDLTGEKNKARMERKNLSPVFMFDPSLNARQNSIVEAMLSGVQALWDAKSCRSLFKVSTMTATRDLTDLVDKGILTRLGKGRATAYTLTQNRRPL